VLNSSVGLDPELGRHYRSDRIFCDYIRHLMNLKIYYVSDAIVYHKLQKSTEILREISDENSHFYMMLYKNQWDDELKAKLGYKTPLWDI
jgi:Zn-finger protein